MKTLLFATILSIMSVAGFATDRDPKKDDAKGISYNAKKQFEQDFAKAESVSWILTSDYQKAEFFQNGKKFTAIYDLQGNYLGATQHVPYSEIPEQAKKELAKRYKDYDFSEALKVIGRPDNDYNNNDIGTYWIDLISNNKQIYLKYTYSTGLVFYKSVNTIQTAQN